MGKKRRKQNMGGLDGDVEMDMTPMIDVVFNLIIFFMVITDMTQKDLEYLILPKAELAEVDEGKDRERLVLNIVNPDLKDMQGKVDPNKPPIFFEGRQVDDMVDLRRHLRQRANPRLYPQKIKEDGVTPMPQLAPGLWPSRKPLLIRCDQAMIFAWVQAVIQYCTFVPGNPQEKELAESPFIWKIEMAVAEKAADK